MDTEKPIPVEIHHAMSFLDVVLCTSSDIRSGHCDAGNPNNRIYLGMIHVVHKGSGQHYERHYERRIVTMNSTSPFNYLSVSKPVMYSISDY